MTGKINILVYANNFQKFYRQMFQSLSSRYNFTQIEIDTLLFLHNNPQYNSARDICTVRGLAKSNVSTSIHSLRRRGYLTSSPDESNRKVHRLALTKTSETILKELCDRQSLCYAAIMDGFTEDEFEMLRDFLKRMDENVLRTLKNSEMTENE